MAGFRAEEGRETLPVPFVGGSEFIGRDVANVVGVEDLGLLVGGQVDAEVHLQEIAATYGRMGAPSSLDQIRLASGRFDDLYWARTKYTDRAAELRDAGRAGSAE